MSERLKTTSAVSNEDVIDELTQNLEANLVPGDKADDVPSAEAEEFVINPPQSSNSFDDLPSGSGDEPKKSKTQTDDNKLSEDEFDDGEDDEKPETQENESDSEIIDEVALKDQELDLTDDQKAERKVIAEELKMMGNNAFKDENFERSIEKYTEGLKLCPLQFTQQRAILYCNRGAARTKLEKYKLAIKDCSKAVELDEKYVKAYSRRAQCYELTNKLDEALSDFKKILELDPSHVEAQRSIRRLPPLIEERNEKLKTEMLGKLKDLGNMILKPFGLSTENFKMEQDSEGKGYKINFNQ